MNIIRAQGQAEALKIKGEAEAAAYRMQAEAEAAEMKMKGYTYAEETARKVGVGAVENGFGSVGGGGESGNSGGSGLMGDLVNLGVGLSAMSSVMGMTKDAMSPLVQVTGETGQSVSNLMNPDVQKVTWNCSCGMTGLTGNFCSNCGKKKGENTDEEL